MIFNSLEFIENLTIEERFKHFGDKQKASVPKKRYCSNMMLNSSNNKIKS